MQLLLYFYFYYNNNNNNNKKKKKVLATLAFETVQKNLEMRLKEFSSSISRIKISVKLDQYLKNHFFFMDIIKYEQTAQINIID